MAIDDKRAARETLTQYDIMLLDCPTPLFSVTDGLYAEAQAMGLGSQDTAAVKRVLDEMTLRGCRWRKRNQHMIQADYRRV